MMSIYSLALLPGGKLLLGTGNQGAVLELDGNHIYSRLVKADVSSGDFDGGRARRKIVSCRSESWKDFHSGTRRRTGRHVRVAALRRAYFLTLGTHGVVGRKRCARQERRAARALNSSRARETPPIPKITGARGLARIRMFQETSSIVRPRGSCNGKRCCTAAASGPPPEVDWVSVAYLPKNVAPEVTAIALQSPGIRVQGIAILAQNVGQQTPVQLRMPQPATSASSPSSAFAAAIITNLAIKVARSDLMRCRRDSRKRAISPFCGPPKMPTTTSSSFLSISAAKMKPRGNCSRTNWTRIFIRGIRRRCPTAPTT